VTKDALEVWSPLPPSPSGIADYVEEQLDTLSQAFALTLCVEDPDVVAPALRERHRVVDQGASDGSTLRVYHVGNSPAHGSIYREALRTPGIVVLHEWNLHELLLSFAVRSNEFDEYRRTVRREHGEAGSVAGLTIASALGGRHWTGVFPLNAEILSRALGVVCLSSSTAARAAAKVPGVPLLHLPHHACLRAKASNRTEARKRLGLDERAPVVLAPGLGTAAKSLEVAREAMRTIRARVKDAWLVTVGGGVEEKADDAWERALGRVDLETLGDALLAADVVLALRFPSRGETSGVLMRALSAGRAAVVTAGSAADEDLPQGVVARLSPGPGEARELAALLEFLLTDEAARGRMERLAFEVASTRPPGPVTERLVDFVRGVARDRAALEAEMRARAARGQAVRELIRDDLERAAASLGLSRLPAGVFERLARL
jgi:glycosyltransferase involved in cell wall biosynthesis